MSDLIPTVEIAPQKELEKGWQEVAEVLTRSALLGKDSDIFRRGLLTGTGHKNVARLTHDSILVNQPNSGIINPVVFENFTHFFDLFEELSRNVDPEQIKVLINKSVETGTILPSINQRVGELADNVIDKFFIGSKVTTMTGGDIDKLRLALNVDKTAGWVFMFYLMRIPSKYLDIAYSEANDTDIPPDSWEQIVDRTFTQWFSKRRELDAPPDERDEYMKRLQTDVPPFIERYLRNPITVTHVLNRYSPGEYSSQKLNVFIESKVNPETIKIVTELLDVSGANKISGRIIDEVSSLIYKKGRLMEATYVEPGVPTERVVVSGVIPKELKKQYDRARQTIHNFYDPDLEDADRPSKLQLKLAWERYWLTIDKMILRLEKLEEDGLVAKSFRKQWNDLGNLAWKQRGRRELTPEITQEREARIRRFEEYLASK